MSPDPKRDGSLPETVGRKARRKQRARETQGRHPLFWLGMFGLVGWAVAVPTLLGTALGLWLDRRWPAEEVSWTLSLLILGAGVGCLNAWYWIQRESQDD